MNCGIQQIKHVFDRIKIPYGKRNVKIGKLIYIHDLITILNQPRKKS